MNAAELDILLPAFAAGLLMLATHIPLGMKVLARGVIFADLAVAQIAALGVIIAVMLGLAGHPLFVQLVAGASALSGAALLAWIEHRLPDVKEACIGLAYVLAACGGIMLTSGATHGDERFQYLLTGQILWVGAHQLAALAAVTAFLLALWRWPAVKEGNLSFYGLFALAVTATVQLAGVYLVFASLIVPALATYRIKERRMHYAFAVGISGYAAGLVLSARFDFPGGAAIVLTMAVAGAAVALLPFRK